MIHCNLSVGRVDPTMDDLVMAFNDSSISMKEMLEYTRNVETSSLSQKVTNYPAPSQSRLIYPHDEDELSPPDQNGHDGVDVDAAAGYIMLVYDSYSVIPAILA